MSKSPTTRFTSRVQNYVNYRPHYPSEVIGIIQRHCGLTAEWIVADIGSGTGISSELFLQNANTVWAVEPNDAMRQAAENQLCDNFGFRSIKGSAESTTLPDESVDLVVAGQAFHWFELDKTRSEFLRILKPGGWVVLMWNERPSAVADDDGFLIAYDQLLHTFSPDYASVDHRNTDHVKIQAFFDSFPVVCDGCPNQQTLDLPSLEGRLLSSSYAPEAGQEGHEEMMLELRRIFLKHARNGNVVMPYQTRVYMGQL